MSITQALIEYIKKFPDIEIVELERVGENNNSYAIYPVGNGLVSKDVLGNKKYKRNFIFLAKRPVSEQSEIAENYDFLEDFCDWVEENNDNYIYPDFGNNITVDSLDLSNIMLMNVSDGWDLGTYQIQINLIYTKESN